jgi:hypothetical protein
VLAVDDPAAHVQLAWVKPLTAQPIEAGISLQPWATGSIEVLAVDQEEVVVRFSGLAPKSWSETAGAESALEGQAFHALRACE